MLYNISIRKISEKLWEIYKKRITIIKRMTLEEPYKIDIVATTDDNVYFGIVDAGITIDEKERD